MKHRFNDSLAIVLTPPSDAHCRLAAQIGVRKIVVRYPMVSRREDFEEMRDRLAGHGLSIGVVEGYLPIEDLVHGRPGRDLQLQQLQELMVNMKEFGVETLCYNFMPFSDMTRTSYEVLTRGGARTNTFDLDQWSSREVTGASSEKLWENLDYFLSRILPIAEENGIKMAIHPDDPPMPKLGGINQIFSEVESFERLVRDWPSPSNRVCFCQGTFAEMGVDIPATIRRLGDSIAYVHCRDVKGTVPHFEEAFHDDGKTDMAAAMRAYREIGYSGLMRPDHVPSMEGEAGAADGYSMLGRIFAVGYLSGLMCHI